MKRIAFLMIALFMIGGVVMAQGQRGEHKKMTPAERAEKMTERMVKEYSLNDVQKKQLLEENLARCEKMDARMSMRPDVNGKKDGKKAPQMTKEQKETEIHKCSELKVDYFLSLRPSFIRCSRSDCFFV